MVAVVAVVAVACHLPFDSPAQLFRSLVFSMPFPHTSNKYRTCIYYNDRREPDQLTFEHSMSRIYIADLRIDWVEQIRGPGSDRFYISEKVSTGQVLEVFIAQALWGWRQLEQLVIDGGQVVVRKIRLYGHAAD